MRGEVRVKSFTERPEDIAAYGPLRDEAGGRAFVLTLGGRARGQLIATVAGIAGRADAEALRGTRLYADRDRLPAPEDEDEFYHADLLGLAAVDMGGRARGRVAAILPAGDAAVLEIDPGGGADTLLVPFTRQHVPAVDIAAGRIEIDPPEDPGDGDADADAEAGAGATQEEQGDGRQ